MKKVEQVAASNAISPVLKGANIIISFLDTNGKWKNESRLKRRLELIPTIIKLQNFGVLCIIASCRGEGGVQILAH